MSDKNDPELRRAIIRARARAETALKADKAALEAALEARDERRRLLKTQFRTALEAAVRLQLAILELLEPDLKRDCALSDREGTLWGMQADLGWVQALVDELEKDRRIGTPPQEDA